MPDPEMMPGRALAPVARAGIYTILEAALPGREPCNIGVMLIDSVSGRGWLKMRDDLAEVAGPEDAEVFEALADDLREHMNEEGAEKTLELLEDTLSNALRISDRHEVSADSFTRKLEQLYQEHVAPVDVRPFETHLPLYSLRAAAGHLSEEMPAEPEGWIPAPPGMKLDENLFVAHVSGHSMEPRIPDGSLNLFRFNPVGSRQGKIVLVEQFGETNETARYTVKRYTSEKTYGAGMWEHTRITLEPLNPEYKPWDVDPEGFAVVAEWLRVIE
jgi:SOS-response transcriptional repressor LexA